MLLKPYLEKIKYMGEDALRFGNDELEGVLVPNLGSNLLSLVYKKSGTDIFRTPDSIEEYHQAPTLFGHPVLFPPNRIEDGAFKFQGRDYQFTINEPEKHNRLHGFVHDKPWKLIAQHVTNDQIQIQTQICSEDFPSILQEFPHSFSIIMTYNLKGSKLSIEAEIENKGEEVMPAGIGYHTTIPLPLCRHSISKTVMVRLPVHKKWLLNERSLPTGEWIPELRLKSGILIKDRTFDDIYQYDAESTDINEALLEDREEGLRIRYQSDENFRQWVLFNDTGFICLEPYSWVTNAPNLDLPENVTGMKSLQPKEKWTVAVKFSAETI
ncbi:aldose 1-epimerase [Bacillus massiliglaciei]|uniref:aldose 1-epimerase n=1 Tax=Bacillus massiliglaciei TaxID=1816693 RepID=UPI000A540807|nr:aldose 1-epimerase [Bacillus massiliglaciei]